MSANIVFGCTKTSGIPDDHVEALWSNNDDRDECSAVKKAVLEAHSRVSRPHLSYPEFMSDPTYRHGISSSKTTEANEDAKDLIFPNDNAENNCSHGSSYKPGQQITRNYNWPVNPKETVFGIKGECGTGRGRSTAVADALRMKDDSTEDIDSRSKQLADPEKIFGKSTSEANSSAADCLSHSTSLSGDIDDTVGKSLTPGFRNAPTQRKFGCPSIRTDIAKYERASVADTQNYGDDVNAGYLLRPSLFSSLGLEEDEFERPRSKGYLKRLFAAVLKIADGTFEETFSRVSDRNNCASINSCRSLFEDSGGSTK